MNMIAAHEKKNWLVVAFVRKFHLHISFARRVNFRVNM